MTKASTERRACAACGRDDVPLTSVKVEGFGIVPACADPVECRRVWQPVATAATALS